MTTVTSDIREITESVKLGAVRSMTQDEIERRLLRSIMRISRWIVCRIPDVRYPRAEIVWISPRAEDLFRYVRGELLGKDVSILIPERFRDAHAEHMLGYIANPTPRTMGTRDMDLFGLTKDGEEFPIGINLSPEYIDGELHVFQSIVPTPEVP